MRDFSTCRHRPCAGDPDWKGVGPTDRGGRDTPDRSPGQAPGHDREALAREVKFLPEPPAAVADDGVFEGYASLFGIADLGKDVVAPGAFTDSLARRGSGGVRMLWQHDPAEPIGRWLSIAEDARGLRVRGRLNLAVERARELHALMRDGAVDGLSIGFRVERARNDKHAGLRRLERVDLWEISLVTFPMLPGARVSAAKRAPTLPPRRGKVSSASADDGKEGLSRLMPTLPARSARHPPPLRGEGKGASLALAIRRAAARLFNA